MMAFYINQTFEIEKISETHFYREMIGSKEWFLCQNEINSWKFTSFGHKQKEA